MNRRFETIECSRRATAAVCLAAGLLSVALTAQAEQAKTSPPPAKSPGKSLEIPNPRATLRDLAAAARAREFELPQFDEGKIAAAGIRRIAGKYVMLYTDLPAATDVDELPRVFDAAVPLWCSYFGIDATKFAEWKLVGSIMKDKERFLRAGLYVESLPEFQYGFTVGSQFWVYEQQSSYYRRHLMLHEGTHAFMLRWLGGAGPPWYMEGMAELLGTHRWENGQLTLGIMPARREDVPYWGRVKIVKTEIEAGRSMSLIDIMRYDAQAHLQIEAYGWCWAAAHFLDQHPLTQTAFRELKNETQNRTLEFSKRFYDRVKDHWPSIVEDWQLFVHECNYGYDVARAAVSRKPAAELPVSGASVMISADRGWQSTGIRVESGKKYRVTANGRYEVATKPKPWPCEPGGITIRYHLGRPLGMLLGAISDVDGERPSVTPLLEPVPIGPDAEIEPNTSGTLYLKINESASGLADNVGSLTATIRAK